MHQSATELYSRCRPTMLIGSRSLGKGVATEETDRMQEVRVNTMERNGCIFGTGTMLDGGRGLLEGGGDQEVVLVQASEVHCRCQLQESHPVKRE